MHNRLLSWRCSTFTGLHNRLLSRRCGSTIQKNSVQVRRCDQSWHQAVPKNLRQSSRPQEPLHKHATEQACISCRPACSEAAFPARSAVQTTAALCTRAWIDSGSPYRMCHGNLPSGDTKELRPAGPPSSTAAGLPSLQVCSSWLELGGIQATSRQHRCNPCAGNLAVLARFLAPQGACRCSIMA